MKRKLPLWLLIGATALMAVGYAWLVEPNRIVVRQVVIKDSVLARAWPGLTIVHLSDLHIERLGAREDRVLAMVRDLHPDLIALSGDYKQWMADPEPAQRFLAMLSAPLGVYGVLGDADSIQTNNKGCAYCHPPGRYHERLERPCILQNESRRIVYRGGGITVTGIAPEEGDADESRNMPGQTKFLPKGFNENGWLGKINDKARSDHEPLLVLSHSGKRWQETRLEAHSLWLAGDTHGGQIWLPEWFWPLIPYKPDPQHMGGVYENDRGGWLVVNRGLGTTARFPFRLGVPPEILVISFSEKGN